MKSKIKSPLLHPGDKIAVIAPSSPGDFNKVDLVEKNIRTLGFDVEVYPSCYLSHGHLAGKDEDRLKDLHRAFGDPTVKGIFCTKGGAGSYRLLPHIDYGLIGSNPKVFLGYSDVTALHLGFFAKAGLVTYHGPMALSSMYDNSSGECIIEPFNRESLLKNLMSKEPLGRLENPPGQDLFSLYPGKASGEIVGGNLSLMVATLGSPYEVDCRGRLLFIEDTLEANYAIDRMLNSLALAGKFREAEGIILGTFTHCKAEEKSTYPGKDLSLDEIFEEVILPYKKPTILNLYAGHNSPQITIPLGVMAEMDSDKLLVDVVESSHI